MDEKLIVEIAGDASKYAKMLDEAKAKTESSGEAISSAVDKSTSKTAESFEKAVEIAVKYAQKIRELETELDKLKEKKAKVSDEADKLGDKILNIGRRMENLGTQTKQAGEALSKLTAGISLQETFEAFNKQEKAEKLLEAALRSQKQNVKGLSEEYQRYAKELQSVTTYGDQLILELAQQATSFGLNEQQTKRAVRGAIGLAEATGRSTREVVKATVKLEAGSTEMLQEYMPTLLKITDKTEKVAKAHELLGQMFDVAREGARTSAGTLKQLDNSWTDFKETIGKVIAEKIGPLIDLMKVMSDQFQKLPTWVKESIVTFLVLITTAGFLLTGIGALIVAFGTLAVVLENIIGKTALATVGFGALKVVLIGGVAYAAYQAGKFLSGVDEELNKLNETIDKSRELNDKWANRFTDNTSKVLKDVQDIDGRSAKSKFLSDKLRDAQKELNGLSGGLQNAQKNVHDLVSDFDHIAGVEPLEVAKRDVDDFKRKVELAKTRVELFRETLQKINDVSLDTGLVSDIKKVRDEFKLQSETVGMSSDQIKIYQFVLRGASAEMLTAATNARHLKEYVTELNKSITDLRSNSENIKFELDTQNLTKTEKEILKLRKQLDNLGYQMSVDKNLQTAQNQIMIDTFKVRIDQYETLLKKQDAVNKRNEQMKKGMEILRSLDPVEQYRITVDELTDSLNVGAINWDIYKKGVDEARKKLDDAAISSVKLKEALGNLNAAKFGSGEARDRIDKMNEALRIQVEQWKEVAKVRERASKLSFDKIPKEFKENPFFKDLGKNIGTDLGDNITKFFQNTGNITDKLFPERPIDFLNRQKRALGLPELPTPDRSNLNQTVIDNVKQMLNSGIKSIFPDLMMKEIDKLQERKLSKPELEQRLIPQPMSTNDAAADRKETNTILKNIDKTLVAMNTKPASTLGIVNIEE